MFAGQYGSPGHPLPGRDADIDGDGHVDSVDFSFIQINFLDGSDSPVGDAVSIASASGPMTSISVRLLARYAGLEDALAADLSGNGIVDAVDTRLFILKHINIKRGR